MKTAYKIFMTAAVILTPGMANRPKAQTVLTLDKCVETALANNALTKSAANNLGMAQESQKSAVTRYFPNISASATGFIADKGLAKIDMAPGVSMSMMKDGIVGGILASQPVFAGGQIVNANKLAKVNVERYRLTSRQAENEVRLTTEQYFWQIVVLKEKQNTISAVETQLEQLDKDVTAAVKAGVTNRNDLLQIKLKRNDMASSRLTVANELALSKRLLAQYMGMDINDSIDVAYNTANDSMPESPASLYRHPDEALISTPEYGLLQAGTTAAKIERKMATGKLLPTVAIGGGYMYDNLTDRDKPAWIGFATVSVPLSDWWGGSHDIKRQKMAESNAEIQQNNQSQLLKIKMQAAWDALNKAYRQIDIARSSIRQSGENLRLNQDYYKAGTTTMSELLDAQTLFRQSRDSYVEARAEYEIKKCEYMIATGQ